MSSEQKGKPLYCWFIWRISLFWGDEILASFCLLWGSITKDYDNDDVSCLITKTIAVAQVLINVLWKLCCREVFEFNH